MINTWKTAIKLYQISAITVSLSENSGHICDIETKNKIINDNYYFSLLPLLHKEEQRVINFS